MSGGDMRQVVCLSASICIAAQMLTAQEAPIIHDAEYYILEAQNGEKWTSEDKAEEEAAGAV